MKWVVEITGYGNTRRFLSTKTYFGFTNQVETAERFNSVEDGKRIAGLVFQNHPVVHEKSEVKGVICCES
jgi:hypothetical protein